MKQNEIIIIGAGIVGVMLALQLATKSNAKITLIDKNSAGNGVTKHSFAWLNISYGRPDNYQKLRAQALNAWHELDKATNHDLNIQWTGAISWQESDEATLAFIQSHQAQKFKIEALSQEAILLKEPLLNSSPKISAFAVDEGAIDPIAVTNQLLQAAIKKGINYLPHQEVTVLLQDDTGKVIGISTANTQYLADQVILTAGVDNKMLLNALNIDLPITISPAIIIRLKHEVFPSLTKHIISNPQMEIRAIDDQHLLVAEDYIDDAPENSPEIIAKNALKAIERALSPLAPVLSIDKVAVGLRPMPRDEMPIVGFLDSHQSLYLISMHAAVTLSPLISQLAATEIIEKRTEDALTPYRLSRFKITQQ